MKLYNSVRHSRSVVFTIYLENTEQNYYNEVKLVVAG